MPENKDNFIVYTAQDIARILVRNPEELTDLLTYDYICETHGNGRAFDDMPEAERKLMLSPEAAAEELEWLGFRSNQINIFMTALKSAMNETGFDHVKPDIGIRSLRERFEIVATTIMAFPYGPGLAFSTPNYPMKSKGFSIGQSKSTLATLTNRVATLIFQARSNYPDLLCVQHSIELQQRLDSVCEPLSHK